MKYFSIQYSVVLINLKKNIFKQYQNVNKIDGIMSSNNSHKTCALELFHLLDISHMSVTDLSPFLFSPKTTWVKYCMASSWGKNRSWDICGGFTSTKAVFEVMELDGIIQKIRCKQRREQLQDLVLASFSPSLKVQEEESKENR